MLYFFLHGDCGIIATAVHFKHYLFYFLYSGVLSAPEVTYIKFSDNHSVLFSWNAPFSLNITDVEPDIIYYTIHITVDSAEHVNTTTTDTHYVLQADPCRAHTYTMEIAAVNVVGEGEKYVSPELILEGNFLILIL